MMRPRRSPVRKLIYLTCFSDPLYVEAARLCIASLRSKGRYTADIAVLTDGIFPEGTPGATVVRVDGTADPFELRCWYGETSRIRPYEALRFRPKAT